MIPRCGSSRISTFSDETLRLIGDAITTAPQDKIEQVMDIATDQTLWEDDVIQKLTELLGWEDEDDDEE